MYKNRDKGDLILTKQKWHDKTSYRPQSNDWEMGCLWVPDNFGAVSGPSTALQHSLHRGFCAIVHLTRHRFGDNILAPVPKIEKSHLTTTANWTRFIAQHPHWKVSILPCAHLSCVRKPAPGGPALPLCSDLMRCRCTVIPGKW